MLSTQTLYLERLVAMGFFGGGRERELERQLKAGWADWLATHKRFRESAANARELEERCKGVEQRLERAEKDLTRALNDLQTAHTRINELDPPPPTTVELARETIDLYLRGKDITKGAADRANFAFNVLAAQDGVVPNAHYGSTPRR